MEAGPSSRSAKRRPQDPPTGGLTKRPRIDNRNGATPSSSSRGKATSLDKSSRSTQTIVLDDDDEDNDVEALDIEQDDSNTHSNEVYTVPPSSQTQANLVPCPACGRSIPFSTLNAHLDRSCRSPPLQGGGKTSKSAWAKLLSGTGGDDSSLSANQASAVDMTRKISKPNYHLATPKELRAVLEMYGCPTVGEKAVLIERVQLWISIFKYVLSPALPSPRLLQTG